jgi:hypothetical protein
MKRLLIAGAAVSVIVIAVVLVAMLGGGSGGSFGISPRSNEKQSSTGRRRGRPVEADEQWRS